MCVFFSLPYYILNKRPRNSQQDRDNATRLLLTYALTYVRTNTCRNVRQLVILRVDPFSASVPFRGQTTRNSSGLSPSRDYNTKGAININNIVSQGSLFCGTESKYTVTLLFFFVCLLCVCVCVFFYFFFFCLFVCATAVTCPTTSS